MLSVRTYKGSEKHVFGNWVRIITIMVAENLEELCSTVIWKGEFGYLVETSKQNVKGMAWFLPLFNSERKERN
jgi:hypothetical protein